jgi:metal-responsive CopG/Arc/MetJ family transcriptional regulator
MERGKTKMKNISVRIDKDLLRTVDKLAKNYGTTRSYLIRTAINEYIENEILAGLAKKRSQNKNDPVITYEELKKELRRSK